MKKIKFIRIIDVMLEAFIRIPMISSKIVFLLFMTYFIHFNSNAQIKDDVSIIGSPEVCGDSSTLEYTLENYTPHEGDEIEWSLTGNGGAILGNSNDTTVNIIWSNSGTENLESIIHVSITRNNISIASDDFDVTIFYVTKVITDNDTVKSLFINQTGNFTIEALGIVEPVTYRWYQKADETGSNFGEINQSNAIYLEGSWTSNTLVFTPQNKDFSNYQYYCKVQSGCGNDSSSIKTLNIYSPASIGENPQDTSVCESSNANFEISATGDAISYQWIQIDTNNIETQISDGGQYYGCTTATLRVLNSPTSLNRFKYKCMVTSHPIENLTSTVPSNTATLTVHPTPSFSQGAEIEVPGQLCQGDTVSISVEEILNSIYHWRFPDSSWVIIADSTSESIVVKVGDSAGDLKVFTSSIYNCGYSDTLSAHLPLGLLPQLYSPDSLSTSADVNGNAQFDAISVNNSINYQWKVKVDTSWENIGLHPSNEPTYDISDPNQLKFSNVYPSHDDTQYKCLVTGCGGSIAESEIFTLFQKSEFSINASPITGYSYCYRDSIIISASLNTTLSTLYEWYRNDTLIQTQESSILQEQSQYCGDITYQASATKFPNVTVSLKIHVNELPNLGISSSTEYCKNQKGILLHVNEPDPNLTYTWDPFSGFEAWSDTKMPYLIVNYGEKSSAQLTITARNNTTNCEKTRNFPIHLSTLLPDLPDTLEWTIKGDYILVFKPETLLQNKTWYWGITDLTDFSESQSSVADSFNYHDFYPELIPNSGKLHWVEVGNIVKDACNARYYYNVPMRYKSSPTIYSPVPSLLIYPNPTSGLVHLRCPDYTGEKLSCQVYDIRGLMLRRLTLAIAQESPAELDLSSLPSGLYLLKVSDDRGYTGYSRIIIAK